MTGQTILQYEVLETIGRGGMGVVYKARDLKLDRLVALKFLPPHLASSETENARFMQEAKAASALNHANICTIHDIMKHDDQLFIVMEFIEGETVKARIQGPTIRPDQIIEYGLLIAGGLRAAHAKGIVHRDIKSDNIILAKDGRLKIMDFGLAKLKGVVGLTKTGSTVGTLGYMAPEQIQGKHAESQADLWSFGVVLYEMATKHLPFTGEHEAAVIYEILNADPKAIEAYRSDIPRNIQNLISQLLQKDPRRRTGSADEIIDRLRAVTSRPAGSREKSIAVLYFENMSPEAESEYFCAGITEDIITDLSKIREIKVVSRTDVLPLRNKAVNTTQVGEILHVNYILEGSVRKAGNRLRITAQLIDVQTGFHLWADRFDRLVEDVFEIQTEVSQKIAQALKISLSESEKQSLAHRPTDDLRAYDFYMRGKELLSRRGKKNTESAIQMFENALSLDRKFAAAYAALGEAYSYMFAWYDGDQLWLEKTVEANQKALSFDPDSAEAQFGIGAVYFHQKRLADAKRTWEKVIQQEPDFYDAYRWLGIASDLIGDYDAALRYYDQCARLKPYSEEPWMHYYMTHLRKGDKAAAEKATRRLLEVGEKKLQVNPDDAITLSRMGGPYASIGEKGKAAAALERALELDPTDGLVQYNCACSYAVLGEFEKTLACLRIAFQNGYKNVRGWVKSDPDLVSLHDNPEFKALIAEFG